DSPRATGASRSGRSWGGGKSEGSAGPLPSAYSSAFQTRQLADLQTQDAAGMAGAAAGLMPGLHQLRRRDTHFPICTLCCGCCNKQKCGWCCKT
uniref:Hepcidin antimicrobial peptide n=1 Tax=Equus caballus TaxID=9796 RepID=A0A9L0S975_HORSE